MNASEEFLGQRDDDARRASHVAESVLVLVLGHLAVEFGAVGAQASDSVVDAFDCKHDAPEAQRVRRCDRRFDLDQFWIAKIRQLKPPVPIWGPHHNDVDLDAFEPVDAVHPWALDRHLAFDRHAERGEKSDRGRKVVDDDADVIQSLDRHVPTIAAAESNWSDLRFSGDNPRVLKPLRFSTATPGKSEFLPGNRWTGKTERIRLKTEPFATPHIPKYRQADILKPYRSPPMLIAESLSLCHSSTRRYSHRNTDFIGELGNAHFSFRQNDVDANDDCHVRLDSHVVVRFYRHGIL